MIVEIDVLKGKTIRHITPVYKKLADSDEMESLTELHFYTTDNKHYRMFHEQDCCERVRLEDIAGELGDLLNVPILMAEMVSNRDCPEDYKDIDDFYRYLWTYYKFSTINGYVALRWMGFSNGYYSEDVEIEEEDAY